MRRRQTVELVCSTIRIIDRGADVGFRRRRHPTVRALDQRRRVTMVRRLLPVRRNSIKSTSTAATAMITHTHGSMTRLLPLNQTLTRMAFLQTPPSVRPPTAELLIDCEGDRTLCLFTRSSSDTETEGLLSGR